ncbi:MAG: AMP-binding protein [Ignavibacteriales bacterium]|nr:AMP-binding protein [Ignavibacteriales bacterium]
MNNRNTDWLAKWAYYTPEKLFLREYQRQLSWSFLEFEQRAQSLAYHLTTELHLQRGERIAVYSKNRAEYFLLFAACIKTGIVLVPLNFRLTPRELDILIADAEPAMFVFESEYTEQVSNLQTVKKCKHFIGISDVTPFLIGGIQQNGFRSLHIPVNDDIVMILYTAGTTGLSKGVMISHKMLFWNAVNTGLRLDLTSADHTQSYAPLFHTGGWNVLFTPFLLHGGSHTILQSFDAALILELMQTERSTILFGVPTMLQMLSDLPEFAAADLSSVRYAIVGGAAMPIPLINVWNEKGIPIRQGYGLTEVGPNCFSLHQDKAIAKRGSIGFPNFYIDTRIVDEHGKDCAVNETGELWIKSPVVTQGYWKKPKETGESITDGYFHTGDLVKKDEDGYYFVVDRKKNMYISGGENVYPAEIEKYLYTNSKIKETAVIGVPDERWGEVGKAYITLKEGEIATAEEMKNFCMGSLAKYKIPKYFEFTGLIPKTDAGKINKIVLLESHKQSLNS